MNFHKINIPKNNGKVRVIYIVDNDHKLLLKSNFPYLEKRLSELDKIHVNYAFEKGKNCVENALQHIGYNYTLSIDLADFFDSVKKTHVNGILDSEIIELCFIKGSPRQGLPTSPLIATISFLKCDELICSQLKKYKLDVVYTRYADDLTFSFNNKNDSGKILFIAKQAIEQFGFKINTQKTKLQDIRNGRIIINGLAIDKKGIYPTRKTKKKIRAATHQQKELQLKGLIEWSKCKLPKQITEA
ncbi:MAG: reverse transcriptase family protein [Methylococcales bacterium]|nr:reverse transcriptase family protein [Methylococcales bacterium]